MRVSRANSRLRFRKRNFVDEDVAVRRRHDAAHRGGLVEALLLGVQLQRPIAAATGWDLEHAGLLGISVDDGAHMQALDKAAPGDELSLLLDRDAGLDAPDVRLAKHQLVERDVARGRQGDLLNGSGLRCCSATGAESLSLNLQPATKSRPLSPSVGPPEL